MTGHRHLADVERLQDGLERALGRIARVFPGRTLVAVSSLAEGADRLVAERVLELPGGRLIAPLPLPREEYEADFASDESKRHFRALLSRADEVVELAPQPSRELSYQAAGLCLLDRCDVLIAMWDGEPGGGTGGTAETVAEARRRELPIAWIRTGNREPGTGRPRTLGRAQGKVRFENFRAHPRKPRLVLHVGVTGHRDQDLAGCDLDALRRSVAGVLGTLRDSVQRVAHEHAGAFAPGPPLLRLFSRLADGADILVAEVARQQGYELHCPLPFGRDEYREQVAAPWRERYDALLQQAHCIVELDGDPGADDLSESFFESRRMVLRHSDVLIAVWDPSARPSGVWGTTRLVEEARHDDLLVVHVPPGAPSQAHLDERAQDADIHGVPLEALELRLVSLLAPPAATRTHGPPEPGEGRTPRLSFFDERQRGWNVGFAWSLFRDLFHEGRAHWPGLRLPNFFADTAASWEAEWRAEPPLPAEVRERIDAALLEPFAWADKLADYHANLTRSSLVLNYVLAAAAVFFALLGYGLGWTDHHHPRHDWAWIWVATELALILAIVGNTRFGNYRRWHERWIDYRLLAERIRLQRFLAPLGRLTPHTRPPAHLSFGDVRGSWLSWYFRALARDLGLAGRKYDPTYVQAVRAAFMKLIAHGDGKRPAQICWHYDNARKFHLIDHRLHRAGLLLFVATGVSCAAHLVWHSAWLTVACAAFPAFGAALTAIAIHAQLDRIAKHSRSMFECLMGLVQYLARQPPVSSALGPPCEEIAECLTSEVLDWRSLFPGKIGLPA